MQTIRNIKSVYNLEEACLENGDKIFILGGKVKNHSCKYIENNELKKYPKFKGLFIKYTDDDFIISIRANNSTISSYLQGEEYYFTPKYFPIINSSEIPINKNLRKYISYFYTHQYKNDIETMNQNHKIAQKICGGWNKINSDFLNRIVRKIHGIIDEIKITKDSKRLCQLKEELQNLIVLDLEYKEIINKVTRLENEILDLSRQVIDI